MQPLAVRVGMGCDRPNVSAVFLICGNDKHGLANLGELIKHTPKDCDIVVVANGVSPEVRIQILAIVHQDDRVVVIETHTNLGVVAKNFGYNAAQGNYILSVDSDVRIGEGMISKYAAHLYAHPNVGLVGPLGCKMKKELWSRTEWCMPDEVGYSVGYTIGDFLGHETDPPITGTSVDAIPSLCWMFRSSLLRRIGYLNWRFGPFVGSDADFCFRIKAAGMKLHVVRANIWHVSGGGLSHSEIPVDKLELRDNHLKELYDKWYGKADLIMG